ncbi:MAG: tetraacyldisaccharide 4'-kinase, partial [Kiloniellales bacterium]
VKSQRDWLQRDGDGLRRLLIREPRGGVFTNWNLIVPATDPAARAEGVVLLGDDRHGLAARLASGRPLLRARLAPTAEAGALRGRRVLAFAGIGRPTKFFATLAETGAELVASRAFPDHHPYSRAEIEALLAEAERQSVLAVTTAKDAVRLAPDLQARVTVLRIEVAWQDPAALARLLQPVLGSA